MADSTILGGHIATGPRDGWGLVAPHLRGACSFLADAFVEMHPSSFRVWRPAYNPATGLGVYEWDGQFDVNIPPGWDYLAIEDMPNQAAYYWPKIEAATKAEEQRLGVRIDALKCTNEAGGNTLIGCQRLVAFERALIDLAEQDGRRLVVGNYGTDSPGWDSGIWQDVCAPFIIEAARRGHIYGRHIYSDIVDGEHALVKVNGEFETVPAGSSTERIFKELDWFRERGFTIPTIIGELGFVAFPGVDAFIWNIGLYDMLLAEYPEIGFGSLFTFGTWDNANIQAASEELAVLLQERPFQEWVPIFEEELEPPPDDKHLAIVVKLPQDMTDDEWLFACDTAFMMRHTITASHDDMRTVLLGGNADSYVKFSHPERDASAIALVEALGYRWEPLYQTEPPPDFEDFPMTHWPTDFRHITQIFGNNPERYAEFNLPGHEGLDIRAYTSTAIYAVADGEVIAVEPYTDGHNYGNRIRIKTGKWTHIYAHLESMLVAVGDMVKGGQLIGFADSTGNTDGSHLHFTLKSDDAYYGGDDYIGYPYNIIDPTPYFIPFNPTWPPPIEPPPTGDTVNILDYVRGNHRTQFDLDYDTGTQTTQVWHLDEDNWLYVKGEGTQASYERLGVRDYNGQAWIFRFEDTSQSAEEFYAHWNQSVTEVGAPWLPVVCEVGREYSTTKFVQHYQQSNCAPTHGQFVTDIMKVTSLPYERTYPNGQTLTVITAVWNGGEEYDFGGGNVGWRNLVSGADFYFMGWLFGRDDKPINKKTCIDFGW